MRSAVVVRDTFQALVEDLRQLESYHSMWLQPLAALGLALEHMALAQDDLVQVGPRNLKVTARFNPESGSNLFKGSLGISCRCQTARGGSTQASWVKFMGILGQP